MRKPKNVGELNTLYQDADTIDKSLFAEQRSNVLLVAGDHYNKNLTQNYRQLRDNRDLQSNQKLRLTQNWVHKIHRRYVSAISRYSAGVTVVPNLDSDIQNQKSAELNDAVYQHSITRYRLKEKNLRFVSDFVTIGEVCVKLYWDETKGPISGYEQKLDDFGQPMFGEDGQPAQDENLPIFEGEFVFERLFGFNLMRAPSAMSWEDSPYIINRKMAELDELKERYKDNSDVLKSLTEGQSEEYVVFDANKGGYDKAKGQVPIREYYFRPSSELPKGYFFIATRGAILEEGELPYGKFPIVYAAFDEHPTSCRGRSIIKQLRPYQAELNRASSAMAQHQITIGDDKVLYQAGTKLAPGALLPGVRGITYAGQMPSILPGRDGSQYQGYITTKKEEMFDLADAYDISAPNNDKGGTDIYAMLFKSSVQRQNLSVYSERFEQFRMDLTTLFLDLARFYYDDQMLIPAIGKREYVNVEEFRSTDPLDYAIKVVPRDDTIETQWGKQLTLQQMLQYAGGQMDKSDVGMVMRNMPFGNKEEIFEDMTIDYDNAKNTILALERGQWEDVDPEESHAYMIKKLTTRIKQSDFQFLDPQIQEMFRARREMHTQMKAQQDAQVLAAQADYIPVEGAKIGVDMYVEDKTDPSKAPKRARIPQSSLQWLMTQIEAQSGPLMELNDLQPSAQAEYGEVKKRGQQQPRQQ